MAAVSDSSGGTIISFFDVFVGSGEVIEIDMFVDAGGFAEVPEPASLAIFGLGLAGLGFMRRRKLA